jgi:hypothetical protein
MESRNESQLEARERTGCSSRFMPLCLPSQPSIVKPRLLDLNPTVRICVHFDNIEVTWRKTSLQCQLGVAKALCQGRFNYPS